MVLWEGRRCGTWLHQAPQRSKERHAFESQKCIYETLREDLGRVTVAGTPSDMQAHTVFINEPGIYSLVLGSRLPAAVAFKDWVCEEVLPTLRRYGT